MLEYRFHIESVTAPVVYLVHGRAGSRDVMWTFKRSLPDGVSIVAPEAPLADPIGGWSWWHIDAVGASPDERWHEIKAGARTLTSFVRQVEELHSLRPSRRLALGFSQGSGLLSVVVQSHPKLFDGVGVLAGFLLDDPESVGSKADLPPILACHGTRDPVVPFDRLSRAVARWQGEGARIELVEDDVEHKVGISGMKAIKRWVASTLEPIS